MKKLWSPCILGLKPYSPGEHPRVPGLIKLHTNENPYPPSPAVLAALHQASGSALRLYPDPEASGLKQAIADHYALEANHVFVGNGSDEVLAHAFYAFFQQDQPILFPDITYSFYQVYCGLYQIGFNTSPLDESLQLQIADYLHPCRGVVIANPNAPTGIALPLAPCTALRRQLLVRQSLPARRRRTCCGSAHARHSGPSLQAAPH